MVPSAQGSAATLSLPDVGVIAVAEHPTPFEGRIRRARLFSGLCVGPPASCSASSTATPGALVRPSRRRLHVAPDTLWDRLSRMIKRPAGTRRDAPPWAHCFLDAFRAESIRNAGFLPDTVMGRLLALAEADPSFGWSASTAKRKA